jgi:hypothetical protein
MKMYPLGNVARVWPRLSGESHANFAIGARIKDSKVWRGILAGATGLEPATFGVTGQQLT